VQGTRRGPQLRAIRVSISFGLALLAVTGCGRSGGPPAAGSGAADLAPEPASRPATEISFGTPNSIGPVVVDDEGRTLYSFNRDHRGRGESSCYGACARAWPPLIAHGPPAPTDRRAVHAALLGTIRRRDGAVQVTYAGWPLYRFARESTAKASQIGARAFGGVWYPVNLDGRRER
jgi:predicted lipoprotein with Yx(FWY)xxD motif